MKKVAESFFSKHVLEANFYDTRVLNLPNLEIQSLNRDDEEKSSNPFSRCCLLTLSNNWLHEESLQSIWRDFPSCWWINMSNNQISKLSNMTLPLALSMLDLSKNPLDMSELLHLSFCHILRLHLSIEQVQGIGASFDKKWDALLAVNHNLHLVWVFNNDFISYQDRKFVLQNHPTNQHQDVDINKQSSWSSLIINTRQTTIINATHHLERVDHISDTVRLDILLEDYLQECLIWNNFCHSATISNTITIRNVKKKAMITNINSILFVPHRQRLDLSVLLTTRLMFSIPNPLFHDALIILLGEYVSSADIEALVHLPNFAMTALVSLMRRVSKTENVDLMQGQKSRLQVLDIKPTEKLQYSQDYIPTFDSSHGFQFLRDAQRYIAFRFQTSDGEADKTMSQFSELELEILQQLPDIPTKWAGYTEVCQQKSEAKFFRWVPFASRHAIFILNKAPSCPPLNGVCRNSKDQEFYLEMLPLLKAANMSLVDLDIVTVGPQIDGRAIANPMRTANIQSTNDSDQSGISSHRRRIEMAMKLMNGKVLPFGMGLPNGSISSLRWNTTDEIPRNYEKPWQTNTRFAASSEAPKEEEPENQSDFPVKDTVGTFFMTGEAFMHQLSMPRDGNLSPSNEKRQVIRHNYLDNYDNPLANRPPPIVLATSGKEVYKLDEAYDQPYSMYDAAIQNDTSLHQKTGLKSPTSSSKAVNQASNASYTMQEVSLQYNRPSSRSITSATWTAGRRSPSASASKLVDESISPPPNQSVRAVTTIFPVMPTNFEEMKQIAVTTGGALENEVYGDPTMNEFVPVHEIFPPEFHPHSRAPSINTFNSQINQVLSVLSATSPTSRSSSFSDTQQRRVSSPNLPTNMASLNEVNDGEEEKGKDVEIEGGDGVSTKSLVSISLPSVSGTREGRVVARVNAVQSMTDTLDTNDFEGNGDEAAEEVEQQQPLTLENITSGHAIITFPRESSDMPQSSPVSHGQTMPISGTNTTKSPPRVHTVNVFSADHMWNPQFFIAPNSAIDSFNKHFQLFQYYNSERQHTASFQHQYWRSLQEPPLVLMEAAGKNPTLDPQLLARPKSPPRTVFLHSLDYPPNPIVKSPPRSPNQSRGPSRTASPDHSVVNGGTMTGGNDNASQASSQILSFPQDAKDDNEVGNAVFYDDELYTEREKGKLTKRVEVADQASIARSHTYSDVTPSIRGLANSLSDGFGQAIPLPDLDILKKASKPGSSRFTSSRMSTPHQSVEPFDLKKAATEMFRDMGTLRNIRELHSFNEHVSTLRMSSDGHIYKVSNSHPVRSTTILPSGDSSTSTSQISPTLDVTAINEMLLTQRPKLSMYVKPLGMEGARSNSASDRGKDSGRNNDDLVFFTEAPDQENRNNDDESKLLAAEEAYYSQYRKQSTGSNYNFHIQLAESSEVTFSDQQLNQSQDWDANRHQPFDHTSTQRLKTPTDRIAEEQQENAQLLEESMIDQTTSGNTVSGAKLSTPLYPVYPKVMYRLRAEDTLAASYHQQHLQLKQRSEKQQATLEQSPTSPHGDESGTEMFPVSPTSLGSPKTAVQPPTPKRPISPKALQNSVLTPADSLSIASQSQGQISDIVEVTQHPYQEQTLLVSEERIRQKAEQFIANQNLQILQQSQHFNKLLPKKKKLVSGNIDKVTAILTLPTREATRFDIRTPSLPSNSHDSNPVKYSLPNMSYTKGDNGAENTDNYEYSDQQEQLSLSDEKSFQDNSIFSGDSGSQSSFPTSLSGATLNALKNSFSELVDDLRGSIADNDYVAPPPVLSSILNPNIDVFSPGPYRDSTVSAMPVPASSRPPPIEVMAKSSQSPLHAFPYKFSDDIDTSSVASSASSVASSGLNEQGSNIVYRAYSAHLSSPSGNVADMMAVGDTMTLLSMQKVGDQSMNDNNDDASQPMKKRAPKPYQLNSPLSMSSNSSQTSNLLMNLSLSQGQSGSLGLLTERGSVSRGMATSASMSALPSHKAKVDNNQQQLHNKSPKIAVDPSSSNNMSSLMILAPKTADALAVLQQQRQHSSRNKTNNSLESTKNLRPSSSGGRNSAAAATDSWLPPVQPPPSQVAASEMIKAHRRLRSISGREDPVTRKVWVGKQAYKAATNKLQVDPAFRLPTMIAYEKRSQEQQQQSVTNQSQSRQGRAIIMTMTDELPDSA